MKWALALALSAFVFGQLCIAAAAKGKTLPSKKTPVAVQSTKKSVVSTRKVGASPRPGVSGRNTASARTASTRRGKGGRRYARASAGPTVQSHPEPERYQQIQQALAERGYYKGEVNGQWDNASMDAFKRFQADQKLEPDGKINALSLINLGLGPKHDGGALASTVAVMPASSTAQPAQPSN